LSDCEYTETQNWNAWTSTKTWNWTNKS
jgi:hypothetical protein